MDDPVLFRRLLHTMRLVSHASSERLAERLERPTDHVRATLRIVEANGWAIARAGHFAGWSLTAEGRRHGEELLAAELDRSGARDEVEAVYLEFVGINQDFLVLCTDWQLRRMPSGEQAINDHSDPDWDGAVLARLAGTHDEITSLARRLGGALERFSGYERRFEHALGRIEAGEMDWFTKPVLDSYHSVWFELHEDLLATLGRQRSQER